MTEDRIREAETRWRASRPGYYRMVLEMSGDRVETGRFAVVVRDGQVVSLRRNGQPIAPGRGQDYTVDGLFGMIQQELVLSKTPATLGAPGGYSAYLMAQFDPETGRLVEYNRSVGGASNGITIKVLEFEKQ